MAGGFPGNGSSWRCPIRSSQIGIIAKSPLLVPIIPNHPNPKARWVFLRIVLIFLGGLQTKLVGGFKPSEKILTS